MEKCAADGLLKGLYQDREGAKINGGRKMANRDMPTKMPSNALSVACCIAATLWAVVRDERSSHVGLLHAYKKHSRAGGCADARGYDYTMIPTFKPPQLPNSFILS